MKKNYLDLLVKIVILLNISNLYVFVSGVTRIPFSVFGIFFVVILSLYCFINLRIFGQVISTRYSLPWLILFAVLPVASVVIAPLVLKQYIAYHILSFLLFSSTLIWFLKEGYHSIAKWLLLSLAIGMVGVLLSYFFPSQFESIATMQQVAAVGEVSQVGEVRISTAAQGRAFGFYMQPNRAAYAIMIHFILLAFTSLYLRPKLRLALLVLCGFVILLTGSRGGFIYFSFAALALGFFEIFLGQRVGSRVISGMRSLPRYAFFSVLALSVCGAALYLDYSRNPDASAVLRIFESLQGLFSSHYKDDASVVGRLIAQEYYINGILSSPIWGHGLGSAEYGKFFGSLYLSSHNSYLEAAYAYGLPMTFAMYGFFIYMAFSRPARGMREHFRASLPWVIAIYFFLASFITNTVFDYRIFPFVMAYWVGLYLVPSNPMALRNVASHKPTH